MHTPTDASLQRSLLNNLDAAKGGDREAAEQMFKALDQVTDRHRGLVPALREVLKSGDAGLMAYASIALGRLGAGAAPAVPQLIELARFGDGIPREGAVSALGNISGRVTLHCLVELFESSDFRFNYRHVGPALKARGEEVAPFLQRLEEGAARFRGDERAALTMLMDEIRITAGSLAPSSLHAPDIHSRVRILPDARAGQKPSEYFSQHAEVLADREGLIYDGRFLFDVGTKSEVGLRIYRTSQAQPTHVVVFSADEQSYGSNPPDVMRHLATAALHIFGLDPKRTAWVEHGNVASRSTPLGNGECLLVQLRYDTWREMLGAINESHPYPLGKLIESLGVSR